MTFKDCDIAIVNAQQQKSILYVSKNIEIKMHIV